MLVTEAQGTKARPLKEALEKEGELRQEAVVTIRGLQPHSPFFFLHNSTLVESPRSCFCSADSAGPEGSAHTSQVAKWPLGQSSGSQPWLPLESLGELFRGTNFQAPFWNC